MEGYLSGLSTPEVLERRERGEGGAAEQITKTRSQIVRENLFMLFNFLNFLKAGFRKARSAPWSSPIWQPVMTITPRSRL